ncbi:30S ribosomal protein S6 [Planctomicrobium piriforme]|uniref:30S ribosomal protein S6 n=1 Tax=Planctomicrobium piriforme TaxID=1576369 RepID=UPI0015872AFE|nr:30S ribosomal protein S6 [Planctomicrobium piriforme]
MAERMYECMFLLDSGRYAQDPTGTEDTVKEYLTRCNAVLVASAPWQEGKLAYDIDGHRKGLHYLTYFKMDGSQVELLTRTCKLSDLVIRHLIIEHEEQLFELMTKQLADGGAHREEEPAAAAE